MDGAKVLMAVEVVASDVAEASRVVALAAVASQVAEAALAAEASAADLCRIVKTFIVYKRGACQSDTPLFPYSSAWITGVSRFFTLDLEGPVAHTTRGRNRRDERRERSYYHLHRNLNYLVLLHSRVIIIINS